MPFLEEVDDGETVSTCCEIHFSISAYRSTEVSTIYDLTLNTYSSSDSTLVDSIIGYQNTDLTEGDKKGGRYNSIDRG